MQPPRLNHIRNLEPKSQCCSFSCSCNYYGIIYIYISQRPFVTNLTGRPVENRFCTVLYRFLHLLQARLGGIFSLLMLICEQGITRRHENGCRYSLVWYAATPTLLLLLQLPMMRQKSSSLIVIFTWLHDSKIRSSATFYFRKTADVGWDGMGWDSVSSLQSSIETEDGSVYTKLWWKETTKYIAWMPNFCKCIKCICIKKKKSQIFSGLEPKCPPLLLLLWKTHKIFTTHFGEL